MDLQLPQLKYLHQATDGELLRELQSRFDATAFACLKKCRDDEEVNASAWTGSKFTALGLIVSFQRELEAIIHDPDLLDEQEG